MNRELSLVNKKSFSWEKSWGEQNLNNLIIAPFF